MRTVVLIMTMAVMMVFGGIMTVGVSAEADEDVVVEEVVEDDVENEDVEEDVEVEEDMEEPAEDVDEEDVVYENDEDMSEYAIILRDKGLECDAIQFIDEYDDWEALYCQCDGDLYCITIKGEHVDVCVILN